jgi:PHAX RNA-binding domain
MSETLETFIQATAKQLGEPDPGVIAQIRRIVAQLGPEHVAVLVRTVARLEQLGGCLTLHGTRRRTPGGLFIVLARGCMSQHQRGEVWPEYRIPTTTEPPGDEPEGSASSETGARSADDTLIIAPKSKSVNTAAERRYNAHPTISPHR